MMHLTHLLRSDVRHFKLLLAAWLLVQLMSAVYTGIEPAMTAGTRSALATALLGSVLTLIRWLGTAVMVPLLLQTHPLVGSDAFWLTRPIPWRTLLLSKIVLIGAMFVALPVFCDVALMAAFRVPPAYIVLVSIHTALFQALIVALLMTLAAITRSLAGYAMVAGGLLLASALSLNLGLVVAMRELGEGPRMVDVVPRYQSQPYQQAALLVCLTAALVLLLVVQYRSRSRRAAISAGVLGIALAVAIQFVWPWSSGLLAAPDWADRESALRLVVQARRVEFGPHDPWMPSHRQFEYSTGAVRLRLSGVEKTWLATAKLAESSLHFDDGSALATVGNGHGMNVAFEGIDDSPDRVITRDALGVSRVWPPLDPRDVTDSIPAIILREPDVQKRLGATGTYRGRFIVDLDQVQIAGALPLRAGVELRDHGERLVIEGVQRQGRSMQVLLRRIATRTAFDTTEGRFLLFYLRNALTSEAVPGTDRPDFASASSAGLLLGAVAASSESMGFSVRRQLIDFTEQPAKQPAFDVTPAWLAQAELVVVRRIPSGSVARTIEIPGVEIVAAPAPAPAKTPGF